MAHAHASSLPEGTCLLRSVNELPTPTWNHLEINGCDLCVPQPTSPLGSDAVRVLAESGVALVGGAGEKAQAWLEAAAGQIHTYTIQADNTPHLLIIDPSTMPAHVIAADILVEPHARAQIVLLSCDVAIDAAEAPLPATAGRSVRIYAGASSCVELFSLVTSAGMQFIDNTAILACEDAYIGVKQFVLDANISSVGFRADLAGARSRLELDCKYLGRASQRIDIGCLVRQIGRNTMADLVFSGVLCDGAYKSLRDTIDLVAGCKGSKGSENETVLLAGDDVGNQSLPVILCNEDDVAGDHGATVGEISPEQKTYLVSRGIAPEEIPALVMESTFAAGFASAPCAEARAAVLSCAERVPGIDVISDILVD